MRQGGLKGSFTVEAVFILPLVLAVIFSLMYMSLILHDKMVLQSVAEEALVRCNQICHQPSDVLSSEIHYSKLLDVSLLGENKEKHKEELTYYINQEIKNKLFICEVSNIQIDIQDDYCQIDIQAVSLIGLPMVSRFIGDSQQVVVSEQKSYHNPENFARLSDVILGTVKQIKGAARITEFLNKIGNFLGS